jgi:hypothetical protein
MPRLRGHVRCLASFKDDDWDPSHPVELLAVVRETGHPRHLTVVQIWIEAADGHVIGQINLPRPPSDTCGNGRLIQPALVAAPSSQAVLQIACKTEPTSELPGRQEVWLYPHPTDVAGTPIDVTFFDLPVLTSTPTAFARRFPDGGDYWSLTWTDSGVLSMWIDPRTGGGPGTLVSQTVPLASLTP